MLCAIIRTRCVRERWTRSWPGTTPQLKINHKLWWPDRKDKKMKIVIFGLSITSAWGNGHATTFRALAKALHARGHRIVFFEKDAYWYADNRDLPEPELCDVRVFDDWRKALPSARQEIRDCDVAMGGADFADGIASIHQV